MTFPPQKQIFPQETIIKEIHFLISGESIVNFGSFQIGFSSGGAETAEKFHSSLIKNPKVIFRPGIDLKEMLATLKYEKAQ